MHVLVDPEWAKEYPRTAAKIQVTRILQYLGKGRCANCDRLICLRIVCKRKEASETGRGDPCRTINPHELARRALANNPPRPALEDPPDGMARAEDLAKAAGFSAGHVRQLAREGAIPAEQRRVVCEDGKPRTVWFLDRAAFLQYAAESARPRGPREYKTKARQKRLAWGT